MKILVDINHPGHVHFFKNFIWEMEKKGHEIIITASDKDIALNLLDEYKFHYIKLGKYRKNIILKILDLILIDIKMLFVSIKHRPDIFIGIASFRISHAGWLFRKVVYIFDDTEHSKFEILLYKPFATKIFTPSCFLKNIGNKQIRYEGFHEIAYLHPNWFKPNNEILKVLGLEENDIFFILRFVSWSAGHDIGYNGINEKEKLELVNKLSKIGKVIISSELPLSPELKKYQYSISPTKIHNLLYYASIYIGESGTMSTESSILGTYSILISSLAKFCGNHLELADKYKLQFYYDNYSESIHKIDSILLNLKKNKKQQIDKLYKDKIDVTKYLIDLVEKNK